MEKKNIDWGSIGFGYIPTDYRYVANFKDGKWDEGTLTTDPNVTLNECACVFQYAQTVFEGMKAYTTEDGHIVTFRPDLNASVLQILQEDWKCRHSRKIVSLMLSYRQSKQMKLMYRHTAQVQHFMYVRTCSEATLLSA